LPKVCPRQAVKRTKLSTVKPAAIMKPIVSTVPPASLAPPPKRRAIRVLKATMPVSTM
jgi:hypothetical protein